MNRIAARSLAAVSAAVVLLTATACGGDAPDDAGAGGAAAGAELTGVHLTAVEFLRDHTPSDLVREILADYRITDAELAQTRDAFRECMEGQGIAPDRVFSNAFVSEEDSLARDNASAVCEWPTGYVELRGILELADQNPHGLTQAGLVLECFERHGIDDVDHLPPALREEQADDPRNFRASSLQARQCAHDPLEQHDLTPADLDLLDGARDAADLEPPAPSVCDQPGVTGRAFEPDGSVVFCD